MEIWILIGYVIAVIFVLYALTFYLYYYNQNFDCQVEPNFWCWTDWTCLTEQHTRQNGTTKYPAQELYGCTPELIPFRDANYCNNDGATINPGCECVPDTQGNFPPTCTQFGFTGTGLGTCLPPISNILDTDTTLPSVRQCTVAGANLTG